MKLTNNQILENRKKVIAYLQQPHLKKAKGRLANETTGGRCCLGHMCDALNITSKLDLAGARVYGAMFEAMIAPDELVEAVGFRVSIGATVKPSMLFETRTKKKYDSLTSLNDESGITTQGIGQYLESVIMGGVNTPWIEIEVDDEN